MLILYIEPDVVSDYKHVNQVDKITVCFKQQLRVSMSILSMMHQCFSPTQNASAFLSYPGCISVSLLPMMHQHFSPNRDASAFLSYPGCISISFLPRMHQHFSPTLDASKVTFRLCFNSVDQQLNELLDFSSN